MKTSPSFFEMMKAIQLEASELRIYNILAKSPMTIKELVKSTKLSERMIRNDLNDLVKRNLVVRTLIEGKHLKYMYSAAVPESLISSMKTFLDNVGKKRQEMNKDILEGSGI